MTSGDRGMDVSVLPVTIRQPETMWVAGGGDRAGLTELPDSHAGDTLRDVSCTAAQAILCRCGSVADVGRDLHAGTVAQLAGRMYDHDVALGEALEHLGGEAARPARADRAEPGPPALHHEDAPAIRRPEQGGSRDLEHTGALPENETGENAVP